jgi:nascent polypeptide-associated complex subunit beta
MNQQEKVMEARKKLKARFGKTEKAGGMRRKNKATHKTSSNDDKKVKEVIKKLGAQPLPDISDLNLFTKDNMVIQFKNPEVYGSFQNQTIVVSGNAEKKPIADCLADVVTQLSPEQLAQLKKDNVLTGEAKPTEEAPEKKENLANFEEEAKKE